MLSHAVHQSSRKAGPELQRDRHESYRSNPFALVNSPVTSDQNPHQQILQDSNAFVPAAHTIAYEAGGIPMLDFSRIMKFDAEAQERLVKVLSEMLDETVRRNDASQRTTDLPMFEGAKPAISPSAFIRRITKYGGLSPCCFVIGLIYLERLKRQEHSVCLTSRSFQRLVLIAVMLAAKFLDDFYYSNKHWAEIGGISINELNALELEFLFRVGFSLNITREDYDWHASQLLLHEAAISTAASVQAKVSTEGCGIATGYAEGGKVPSYSNIADASALFSTPGGDDFMIE